MKSTPRPKIAKRLEGRLNLSDNYLTIAASSNQLRTILCGYVDQHLRHALLCFTAASALECRNGVFSFDVLIDRETSLLIRVCRQAETDGLPSIVELEKPLSSDTVPVIIFFHGGSFVHSSSDSAIYDTLCRRLVGICKAVVVSVNYRRAPENRYPCAYGDGWAAVKWVSSKPWLQSRKDSKVHIYLAGDSSGGNIVHDVAWRAFLPEGEDRDHPACNPFGPNGISLEVIKFPKSLVVVAGLDLIQDWQLGYAEGLRRNGQDVKLLYLEQATIGFYLLPNNEHFYIVMDEIRNFVNPELSINVTYRQGSNT
ncbi:Gibberellin receptor GID1C [Camellia lanceoleosa]|uniref:Gibberellin receptor GID1C n=1 Tax=Camellia lanceoleosa TaxID=1840588 RepID=A0ACC0HTX0_9ERIC|nr:Gibberellin receptor GID1C [Camellia lanceoleosa]